MTLLTDAHSALLMSPRRYTHTMFDACMPLQMSHYIAKRRFPHTQTLHSMRASHDRCLLLLANARRAPLISPSRYAHTTTGARSPWTMSYDISDMCRPWMMSQIRCTHVTHEACDPWRWCAIWKCHFPLAHTLFVVLAGHYRWPLDYMHIQHFLHAWLRRSRMILEGINIHIRTWYTKCVLAMNAVFCCWLMCTWPDWYRLTDVYMP